MCADHTLCTVCMVCTPPPKSHIPPCHNSMQMACESAEREKREGEERVAAHSFPPASSWHAQPLISSPPLFPPSHLSPTPSTHTHTITPTDLAYNHLHMTAPLAQPTSPLTHTNPKPTPMHVPVHRGNAAAAAAPLLAFPSPPPAAAHVLLHLHATPAHTSSKWFMCE